MAKDLDFGRRSTVAAFGEPAIFPGGISFGSDLASSTASSPTDGGKSTIEVVNVLLGEGNDKLDVQGTLDPDAARSQLTNTFAITPRRRRHRAPAPSRSTGRPRASSRPDRHDLRLAGTWTVAGIARRPTRRDHGRSTRPCRHASPARVLGAVDRGCATVFGDDVPVNGDRPGRRSPAAPTGGTVTRSDAAPGRPTASGRPARDDRRPGAARGGWTAISADGKTLTLSRGAVLPPRPRRTPPVSVPGPHGGLTVVHGGGNRRWRSSGPMAATANSLDRLDGLCVGRRRASPSASTIAIGGDGHRRPARSPASPNADAARTVDPFPGCGAGSVLLSSAARRSPPGNERARPCTSPSPKLEQVTAPIAIQHHRARDARRPALRARRRLLGRPGGLHLRARRRVHDRRGPERDGDAAARRRADADGLDGRRRALLLDADAPCSATTRARRRHPDRRRHDHRHRRRRAELAAGRLRRHVAGRRLVQRPSVRHARATSSARSRSTRSRRCPTARTRTTSGSSRSPTRTRSPATTSSTRAPVRRAAGALPTRRLHGLRRRGQRPDHRQPGRRPPRRRLRRRHDPRPARRRPHLRRLRRQRRHLHPRR